MSHTSLRSVVFIELLSVFFVVVYGNTNGKITAPQKNAEYPNKCWDEMTQTAYAIGTHNRKNACQRIHCYPDFRIKYTSCGTHSAAQGYTIEQDLSKGYPECCAKLVKMERQLKRVDYDASAVKISKFKGRQRSFGRTSDTRSEKHNTEKTTENASYIELTHEDDTKST